MNDGFQMRFPSQDRLDDAFPTLIRYTGWLLACGNSVYTFFYGFELPGLYAAAAGMVLYKNVLTARRKAADD